MQVDVVTAVHAAYTRYLPAAWLSLRGQSHESWTWQVQIDGPPAQVMAALNTCGAAADPRVHIGAHGTREGPAVARNIALAGCTAFLVQNLDADDELEPAALAALTAALRAHPRAGFAVGHARDILADGALRAQPLLPVPAGILPRGALLEAWAAAPGGSPPPVHPAGVMWHRDLLLTLGGWSALRGVEDTATLIAGSALADGVLVDTPTLRYRRHNAQRSRRASKFSGGGYRFPGSNNAPPSSPNPPAGTPVFLRGMAIDRRK